LGRVELEKAMRGPPQDYFKKDIKVSKDMGVMLPAPLYNSEFEDQAVEEIANEPPERSQ
jgi:hypothetical protein